MVRRSTGTSGMTATNDDGGAARKGRPSSLRTETAPARDRAEAARVGTPGWVGMGGKPDQPTFLHSGNESGGLFAAIRLGM